VSDLFETGLAGKQCLGHEVLVEHDQVLLTGGSATSCVVAAVLTEVLSRREKHQLQSERQHACTAVSRCLLSRRRIWRAPVTNDIKHGGEQYATVKCFPVIEMSTRGRNTSAAISTEGQDVRMFGMYHEQPSFIMCFVICRRSYFV